MAKYKKSEYKFLRFEKSKRKGKKYDAVLQNKETKREVRVPFGAIGYQQWKDSTGLGLYSITVLDISLGLNFGEYI